MALTTTEEALVRQLLDQQAAILSLAGAESTIISKLGATKVTLADLTAASVINDADLLLIRQGTTDKSVAGSIVKALGSQPDASTTVKGIVELATNEESQAGTDSVRAVTPSGLTTSTRQILNISATVGSNAMTISAGPLSLDFRSTTLGSGAVTRVFGTPSNLVISAGSTLGTISGQQSRIAVLAINNAGTIELAAVNISGGNNLTETGLISTTAEGGAGAADSANVIYSNTARTNVAYRVIGYIESTQSTAGNWATAPSTIQGNGGLALSSLSSIGYGQTWQDVTASRNINTTYYNTTGKPLFVSITGLGGASGVDILCNGVKVGYINTSAFISVAHFIVPPGGSYIWNSSGGTKSSWSELR